MHIMKHHFFGELLGTFILVFFCCGAVAITVLFPSQVSFFQAAIISGLAVTLAIFTTRHLSYAHLNPAVSLAMVASKRMSGKFLPIYLTGQFLGGFLAAAILYVLFTSSIVDYESVNGIIRGTSASWVTAKIFGDFFPHVTVVVAFAAEAVGTFLLVFLIFSLTEGANVGRPDDKQAPLYIGLAVMIITCIIGPLTQAALNPARDLAPRLFASLAGWGKAAFPNDVFGFLVYIFGPITGGVLAALIFTRMVQPLYSSGD